MRRVCRLPFIRAAMRHWAGLSTPGTSMQGLTSARISGCRPPWPVEPSCEPGIVCFELWRRRLSPAGDARRRPPHEDHDLQLEYQADLVAAPAAVAPAGRSAAGASTVSSGSFRLDYRADQRKMPAMWSPAAVPTTMPATGRLIERPTSEADVPAIGCTDVGSTPPRPRPRTHRAGTAAEQHRRPAVSGGSGGIGGGVAVEAGDCRHITLCPIRASGRVTVFSSDGPQVGPEG